MTYRVVITENATANLRYYFLRAARHAPQTAAQWLNRFHETLETLSLDPKRWTLAPENEAVEQEIRQLIFGKRLGAYRALFHVAHDEVQVLHIRRAAMGVATSDELFGG